MKTQTFKIKNTIKNNEMIARKKKKLKSTHAHIYKEREREKHASQIRQINNKNNIDDKQPEERSRYKIHHTHDSKRNKAVSDQYT